MRSPQLLCRSTLGPRAYLVARPRGVVHAYAGPVTRSGRSVTRSGRAMCHTRTARLTVLDPGVVRVEFATGSRAACGRCSASLAAQALVEHPTRGQALDQYGHLTGFDLALLAYLASSEAEVQWVEWLALLVVGYAAAKTAPVVAPTGKTTGPLDTHTRKARARLGCSHDIEARSREVAAQRSANAELHRRTASRETWDDRERLIASLGISNVVTRPRR